MMNYIAILLLLLSSSCLAAELRGRVTAITDGDTLKVFDGQQEIKIRLLNIDAPESKQAFGSRAKQHLGEKVFGKEVIVEHHKKDRYKRILGTIWLDNRNINLEMVEDGYAWAYRQYLNDHNFLKAENTAREKKSGLWVDPFPIPPWEYRKK
jgi:endonuclease YncB( thermonuclease family)